MAGINFLHFWDAFVSDFIDVQNGTIIVEDEVRDYHPIVGQSFCKIGWTNDKDLIHHYSLGRKNERPDFFLKYDGNRGIPIEVKLPNNLMNTENMEQLIEYMRLSDSNIGIYIGESVRVFYRPSLEDNLKIVIDATFSNEDIAGFVFAELFFNATFNIESLKAELNKYYELEKRIDEKKLDDFDSSAIPEKWLMDRYVKRASLQQRKATTKQDSNKVHRHTMLQTRQSYDSIRVKMSDEAPCGLNIHIPQSIKDILDNEVKRMKRQNIYPAQECTAKFAARLFFLKGLLQEGLINEAQYSEASALPSQYGWKKQDRKR